MAWSLKACVEPGGCHLTFCAARKFQGRNTAACEKAPNPLGTSDEDAERTDKDFREQGGVAGSLHHMCQQRHTILALRAFLPSSTDREASNTEESNK